MSPERNNLEVIAYLDYKKISFWFEYMHEKCKRGIKYSKLMLNRFLQLLENIFRLSHILRKKIVSICWIGNRSDIVAISITYSFLEKNHSYGLWHAKINPLIAANDFVIFKILFIIVTLRARIKEEVLRDRESCLVVFL